MFDSFRRRIKVRIIRFFRGISYGVGIMKTPKSSQDILLIKTVKSLLDEKTVRVFYSPLSSKVYAYTKDKKIIVIFDLYSISITNHKFFFTTTMRDGVGEEIINCAKARIENDMKEIEHIISANEKAFLSEVYDNFKTEKVRQEKKQAPHTRSGVLQKEQQPTPDERFQDALKNYFDKQEYNKIKNHINEDLL